MSQVQLVLDQFDILGEGVFWDVQTSSLFWLDVPMPSRLHRFHPETNKHEVWDMPVMICSMAMLDDGSGLLIAAHNGINLFRFETGQLSFLLSPEIGKPFNRCNDGATDCKGRFWFGTMQNNIAPNSDPIEIVGPSGSLYRLDPDLSLHPMDQNITISNTMCWSPDNRVLYFSDTITGWIFAYDFDADSGTISNKREFAQFDRGVPDGSTVDAEGYLWNARWGGSCVVRFAPDGSVDQVVEIPTELITSCTFGGAALTTLYITSAHYSLTEKQREAQPLAGGLFSVEPGMKGLPAARFASSPRTS